MKATLFFAFFFMPQLLFGGLYDDCGYMNYEEFLAIQKNGGIHKDKSNYYQIIIDNTAEATLHEVKNISRGTKENDDYRFPVGFFERAHFYLKKVPNDYKDLLNNFPVSIVAPLLGLNSQQLNKKTEELLAISMRKSRALGAEYYIVLYILDVQGDAKARAKLREQNNFAEAHPLVLLGGSTASHFAIKSILQKYSPREDLKKTLKVKTTSKDDTINEIINSCKNTGTCLPYKYYDLLFENKYHYYFKQLLKESALLALKKPAHNFGGCPEFDKPIRDKLWEYLKNNYEEELCEKIINLKLTKRNNLYSKKARLIMSRQADKYFEEWKSNPFNQFFVESAKPYISFWAEPKFDLPVVDHCARASFIALVSKDEKIIKELKIQANEIIKTSLDQETKETLLSLLNFVTIKKMPWHIYDYLRGIRHSHNGAYNFLLNAAQYAVDHPGIILGREKNEDIKIRILLMHYTVLNSTKNLFIYLEKMLLHPDSHNKALKILFDFNDTSSNYSPYKNKDQEGKVYKNNNIIYSSEEEYEDKNNYSYLSDRDDDTVVSQNVPITVLKQLEGLLQDPSKKEDILTIFRRYADNLYELKDPEAREFLKEYQYSELHELSNLFEDSDNP